MISILRFVFAVLASAALAHAQNNAQNKPASGTPDADWQKLVSLASPAAVKTKGNSGEAIAQTKASIQQQTGQSRQSAQSAKDFYSRYPNDPKAPEARKTEALSALHGVQDGDVVQEQSALATAKAYRENRGNPASDRLDVALAMDRLQLSSAAKAKHSNPSASEKEQMADKLRTEFGNQPQLHDYYAEVARAADMTTAKRIATNLLQWPVTAKVKADAQAIIDRHALLGKPLNLQPLGTDGKPFDLSQQKGGVTVLFTWAASAGTDVVKTMGTYQKSMPPGVQVMYLAIGGSLLQATTAQKAAPIRGPACYQPPANAKATVDYLKLRSGLYLYVLDREGRVAGFGPVGELPNLLAVAMR